MHRKARKALLIVLLLLILLLLTAMVGIAGILLWAPEEKLTMQENMPLPTETPRLLNAADFEPDRSVLFTFPQGTLTDAQGDTLTMDSLRGKETVLIFWSSWCGDCKEYLSDAYVRMAGSARGSGAEVYLVCREGVRDDNREAAEAALQQLGLAEETLMDPDAAFYQALGLKWVPSAAIIDAEGRLVYTGKGGPDAEAISVLLDYARAPAQQTLRFLQSQLTSPAGLVASGYRIKNGQVIRNDTLLSESQGLLMLWAAQTGDRATFDRVWNAVREGMSVNGLTAWRVTAGEKGDVNASLDDLRIIEALALADEQWGLYGYDAAERARSLFDRCVKDGLMRDFASLKQKSMAETVTLCYMDAAAMRIAGRYDARWNETADLAEALLLSPDSLISDALPLYHTRYDAKKEKYTGDTVQMNEACVAVLNAVRAGVAFPETLDWLENTLAAGPVYARYGADGKVLPGYDYESNATYALLVQIGAASGRERLTRLALERMERRRCFGAEFTGRYGVNTPDEHYVFDELEAMLAWAALKQ